MKRIGILGSTGSIGRMALQVIRHLKGHVTALAAKSNIDLLEEQAKEFRPELVAVWDEAKAKELQARMPDIPVLAGESGVIAAATHSSTELLLSAISGFEGVLPTLRAIEAKKDIALANKEVLVAAGRLVLDLCEKMGVSLIPVDSEHTAIFQCLKGEDMREARRIILTASGGPFREYSQERLAAIGIEDALTHPNYSMGAKVTIDSSTLMNKGLEMIETHFLYDMPLEKIEVVIHPEQVIHSMVEFIDGSIMAQMGEPDMLVPIQVALTHPVRKEGLLKPYDFTRTFALHFSPCDTARFRCLDLAYQSLREKPSMPCFMNAANETLVERFLNKEISWLDISQKLEMLMQQHSAFSPKQYDELASVDLEARQLAQGI
ncbi:MAG: 1-deoxy-D-xylulose 5-phosphate reductoisomerase [Chlamydiae bacterium]|nr:1-deoxy-D-xylulose 5-phosphate reductoisomerase [Chlamydiota bacterium]